jgi:hyperosmotically inducible protein
MAMVKRLSVGICGLAVVCMTAGSAHGQSTAQDVKDKSASAAHKTAEFASDTEITAAVKSKLVADSKVSALDIHVETTKGVVTLTGTTKSSAEKAEAIKVARQTSGVKRVVSKLTIEKTSESTVAKAEDKTGAAAKKTSHATKKGTEKTVDAVKGTSGEVAKDTKSVASETGRVLTDAEITSAVKTKFMADKTVSAMAINVDTDHGVVTLKGDVKSAAEKQQALKIARETKGVRSVVDQLAIK